MNHKPDARPADTSGANPPSRPADEAVSGPALERLAVAAAKLRDAMTGYEPPFAPGEADDAGAFAEDALDEDEARETGDAWARFLAVLLAPKHF